jgi:LPS-assembly protein
MPRASLTLFAARRAATASGGALLLAVLAPGVFAQCGAPTRSEIHERRGIVELTACGEQRKQGDLYVATDDVKIHYLNENLAADRVEYNAATRVAVLTGHVQLDSGSQHLFADDGRYDLEAQRGTFHHVHGELAFERKPNPLILATSNPLSFNAAEAERLDARTYRLERATITVCRPQKPTWKFSTRRATLHINRDVALVNANFRLLRVPLVWLPYATTPAGTRRQSGFTLPVGGESSVKGLVLGDAYYWAPLPWFDATLGAQYWSKRGWSQTLDLRATPTEVMNLSGSYYGVIDRGIPGPDGTLTKQGGHEFNLEFNDLLADGWRAVADINELSSLTFRLAFADTFGEAVNAEANSALFLTNNFNGFSLNFAGIDNQDYLNAEPATSVVIHNAPEARFDSVDRPLWSRLPAYFGFDAYADGVYRSDPDITTAAFVTRDEFAPRVTLPLHWGPWLGLTTSYAVRTTFYGEQLGNGVVVSQSLRRTTNELTLDLRPPSLVRVWQHGGSKWKHSFEPDVVYRYVTGVNDFGAIIRFDQNDTLTDTSEAEYSATNRLFRRDAAGKTEEFLTWRLVQKYYFDPTFGGAIVPGERNQFAALDDITPFPFADGPRHTSPIVSDLTITPGGSYDAEFIEDYDTQQHRLIVAGTLLKMHPYSKFTVTLADFAINTDPVLQPHSNQVRALFGYGAMNGQGWNFTGGISYDFVEGVWQNEVVQAGYNGSCCGLAFEYRRLQLPPVRSENFFGLSLVIANIGTFGNIHKQEKIY